LATLSVDSLKQMIEERLKGTVPLTDVAHARLGGVTIESAHLADRLPPERVRLAAVLIPLVDRPQGLTVLLLSGRHILRITQAKSVFQAVASKNTMRDRLPPRFAKPKKRSA
jgi:hypothetical protein